MFEYSYAHFNALLQYRFKLERCKPHKAARYPTKCGVINDVKILPTVSQDILSQSFDVIHQTSRSKIKCIRIYLILCNTYTSINISQIVYYTAHYNTGQNLEVFPGGHLFPCSSEIWHVPLFPKNRKFVFLCSLFPNIVFVPLFPSKFGLCPHVPLK